jgi:hypothetical protein
MTGQGIKEFDYSDFTQDKLNNAFIGYCAVGNLDKIKYMLTSPKMHILPDLHMKDDLAFKWLLMGIEKSHNEPVSQNFKGVVSHEYIEIIDFLIFEYNIEKTLGIEKLLHNENKFAHILNKFEIRDVNKFLNENLSANQVKARKNKV